MITPRQPSTLIPVAGEEQTYPLPPSCVTLGGKDRDRVGTVVLQMRLREFEGLCPPAPRSQTHLLDPEGTRRWTAGGQSEAGRGFSLLNTLPGPSRPC